MMRRRSYRRPTKAKVALTEKGSALLDNELHLAPSEPITVRPRTEGSQGFTIPDRPPEKRAGVLDLDFAKVSTLEEESRRVSDILHAIFIDKSQELSAEPVEATADDDAAKIQSDDCVWGLSPGFSEFARLLATRPEWSRAELEEVAADRSLLLDGALEHINEAAFD